MEYSSNQMTAKGLDKDLTHYAYPFDVEHYEFQSQGQTLKMSSMDVGNKSHPVFVLLHGKNFTSAYFEDTIKFLLTKNLRVIAIDQLGFGKSSKPIHYQYTFQQLAFNTHQLLKHLNVTKYQLLGHSMGGMLAARYALMYPSEISRLYLLNQVVLLGRLPHLASSNKERDTQVALQCLDRVGLQSFYGRGYLSLSGGEQQRVHMARVLAQMTSDYSDRLMFLDEPTSSLDLKHQHQTLEILTELKKQNIGVFAILHDLNLAAQYADKIVILKAGQVLATGTPREVLTTDNIQEAFDYRVIVQKHPEKDAPLII